MSISYRKDIEGLRGLAVLAVCFYHAGFDFFSGGYLGVDIFFVISGYLITSIILPDIEQGYFNYKDFFERRIRRIAPSLFFIILLSAPFFLEVLTPYQIQGFLNSLSALSIFSSNYLFWSESGYFDISSDLKPLIHTWSLSVEEQFYIFYPLVLVFFSRTIKSKVSFFAYLWIFSMSASAVATYLFPGASFYFTLTRAWEFLAGAIIYINRDFMKLDLTSSPKIANLSLSVLLVCIVIFDETYSIPGTITLIPVLATMFLLANRNQSSYAAKILNMKYLGAIGLMSYSLYLWHHIVFAYVRNSSINHLSEIDYAYLILISIFFSFLTWRLVEVPFRRKNFLKSKIIFSLFFLISSFLLLGSLYLKSFYKEDSINFSFNSYEIPQKSRGVFQDGSKCSDRDPFESCNFKLDNNSKKLVIIGDSHARALTQHAKDFYDKKKISFIDMTASGCPFFPGLNTFINHKIEKKCTKEYQDKRLKKLSTLEPSIVLVHSRFPLYYHGTGFNNSIGGKENKNAYVAKTPKISESIRHADYRESIVNMVEEILKIGHKVIIVGAVPTNGWNPVFRVQKISKIFKNISFRELKSHTDIPQSEVIKRNDKVNKIFTDISSERKNVFFLNPINILCKSDQCSSVTKEAILYSDADHLSYPASMKLFDEIINAIWNI